MNRITTDISRKIWTSLKSYKSEMLDFLRVMVNMESPTEDSVHTKRILDYISTFLQHLDYHVSYAEGEVSGGYIIAYPKDRKKHLPNQLLIGHCDTVWPMNTLESMPYIIKDQVIRGPGVYDMKAGLTQICYSIKYLHDNDISPPFTPLILINSDEEKGSRDSTTAIRRFSKISERAYVMEPPLGLDGKLKTERKGLGRFTITIQGKSAHAGLDPGKGASAILELSHQIQKLFSLNDLEKGITINVGMIEGGTNPNVVAQEAKAVIDVRVLTMKDGEVIEDQIRNLKPINSDTTVVVEGRFGRPPMEKTHRNRKLWMAAKKVGKSIGLELEEGTAGGGSDGNTTSQFTATLDGLGTTGDGAHAQHEFIYIDALIERTALLTSLLLLEEP
ncbi:MAG: M20 family metallopeptidase [Saprospiraceae bacterium]|nr:M20 family metallopeptidase [Saprospiraceae bacterium]